MDGRTEVGTSDDGFGTDGDVDAVEVLDSTHDFYSSLPLSWNDS